MHALITSLQHHCTCICFILTLLWLPKEAIKKRSLIRDQIINGFRAVTPCSFRCSSVTMLAFLGGKARFTEVCKNVSNLEAATARLPGVQCSLVHLLHGQCRECSGRLPPGPRSSTPSVASPECELTQPAELSCS